jgi:hypothetical protein
MPRKQCKQDHAERDRRGAVLSHLTPLLFPSVPPRHQHCCIGYVSAELTLRDIGSLRLRLAWEPCANGSRLLGRGRLFAQTIGKLLQQRH